ncbi:MAG: CcdB family protein [Luteimonas sp.]
MHQFGVYRNRNAATRSAYPLLLNVQSDLISETGTRVVVPLAPVGRDGREVPPLMPHVSVNGKAYVLLMPLIAAAELADLGPEEADLSTERAVVLAALDFLVSGF